MAIDYTKIENPYNSLLTRETGISVSTNGGQGEQSTRQEGETPVTPAASGGASGGASQESVNSPKDITDIWINSFIRSANWAPKKVGFYIDGRTGYAEFANIYVSGTISSSSILFGKTSFTDTINAGYHISSAGLYFGSANDAGFLKYTVSAGSLEITNFKITSLAAGSSIDGQYLGALTVATGALANLAITAAKIDNATITATQIANLAITTAKIDNLAITTGKIAAFAVTASEIGALAITTAKLDNLAVTAGKIGSLAITTDKIDNLAITAGKIGNAEITTTQISSSAGIIGGQIALATIAGGNIAATTITAGNITNLTITAAQIANLTISSGKVNTALMSYSHNLVFTVGSATQANWATGTLTTSDGVAYTITAGNTGVMAAKTYVYLDTAVSVTVLQSTTTFSTAVGDGKMLIAVAQNDTNEALFQVFNGIGGLNLSGSNIAALSITANEIAAVTITAAKIVAETITANEIAASTITADRMNVTSLSAISANIGTITAGSISVVSGLNTVGFTPSGTNAIFSGPTGAPTFYVTPAGVLTATGATITGTINATSGYFGGVTNGISVDSTGLTINGTGYINTNTSPNARIELVRSLTGGFTSALVGYTSTNWEFFRFVADGGSPPFTMSSVLGNPNAQFLGHASGADYNVKITVQNLDDGLKIETSGSSARSSYAGVGINNTATLGDGLVFRNTEATWAGDVLKFTKGGALKWVNILSIDKGNWAANQKTLITSDGYLSFPAYHHRSEFDETPAALASTLIARAYWTGGGTSGTQEVATGDYSNDEFTYMKLNTTSTASRSSTLTFNRQTVLSSQSRIETMIGIRGSITNMKWHFGWRSSATEYMFFEFDTAVHATNIRFVCQNTGSTTTADVGTLNVGTFIIFTMQRYLGDVRLYIDHSLVYSNSSVANLPSSGKPYFYIDNKAASEEKIMNIDYIDVWHGRNLGP